MWVIGGDERKRWCDLKARSRKEWLELVKKVESALVGQRDLLEDHTAEVDDIVARVNAASARRRNDIGAGLKTPPTEDVVGVKIDEVTTEAHRAPPGDGGTQKGAM